MRRHALLLTAIAVTASVAAAPSTQHEGEESNDTAITSADVTATGTAFDIAAVVDFGGQEPVVLGTDLTGDAPGGAQAGDYGLDLTELVAYAPDGDEPVLTLEWHATNLAQLPPPEVVRYYWQTTVAFTDWAFQAKTTDIASAGNLGDGEPATVAGNLASYADAGVPSFRIRGNCGTIDLVATGLNNCGHVAWVDGEFDFEANVVRFQLPLDLPNAAVLRPGAVLAPHTSGAWVSLQAGADVGQTRDTILQEIAYTIPTRTASAALVDADGNVVTSSALEVAEDSTVTGTLTAAGVPAGAYTLEVTACFAGNCDTSAREVSVA